MRINKLNHLSIDELKKKEETLKIVLTLFIVVLLILIVVLAYMVYSKGMTPMIAVPIALLPVFLQGRRSLKEIKTEIRSRGQAMSK